MTNTEIIQAIHKEIITRIDKRHLSEQANNELVSILHFLSTLDSLQQKQQEIDLANEIEVVSKRYPEVSYAKLSRIAKRFYELGKKDMKEQMMKEAVEADVKLTLHDKTGDVSLHTGYLPKELGIKWDDKVRIIIVKEEESK